MGHGGSLKQETRSDNPARRSAYLFGAARLGAPPLTGLAALAAGGLTGLAFPPFSLWPLAFLPPYFLLVLLRDRSSAEGRNIALLFGLAQAAGTMHWFFRVFGPPAVSLCALYAAYFGLLGTLVGASRGRGSALARAAEIALYALALEWLRGDAWYLRFPWYTLPHALAQDPAWIAPARWLGAYGFSFALWFLAGAAAFHTPRWAMGLVLIPLACLALPAPEAPRARALLIQAEGPGAVEEVIPFVSDTGVDLSVLPEYSYFIDPILAAASERGPGALARRTGAPVVFGAVAGEFASDSFQNLAAILSPQGVVVGTFPKQHPVPLFIDGRPGRERPVFPVPGGVLGVAICYDFDAPDVAASLARKGATLLAAPTFDEIGWGRAQHEGHELLLRLRAVENDRWILRACSSGPTEAIDPAGRPSRERIEYGETGAVVVSYAHRSSRTAGSYAPFFGPGAAVLSLALLALRLLKRKPSETTLLG